MELGKDIEGSRIMVNKGKWKLSNAFHPTAFEKNVYSISFHRGKLWTDENTKFAQVIAKSKAEAIKKAKFSFGIK